MKYKWHLFYAIIICCILGTIALVYIAYTSSPPSNSSTFVEATKTLFLCLGGLGVILPTYINATNAMEARRDSKIENTFKLLQKWDDPHFLDARKLTRVLKSQKSKISDDELISTIEKDAELKQSIILLFNYFDQVKLSIVTNRIDKELFVKSLGEVILDIIYRFEPFIKTISHADGVEDIKQLKELLSKKRG